jgi:parallel beta-helix repeat protein
MVSHASRVSSRSASAPARGSNRSRFGRSRLRALATAVALASLTSSLASPPAHAASVPTACDKVASPEGSNAPTGSPAAPFHTAQELADSLSPGQVGCLHAGSYGGGLRIGHGGTAAAPIVVRSYPGERALITGRVYVPQGSNYVTVADVNLDGSYQTGSKPLPSPTINANHVTFESDDVTNDHTEICFDVGSSTWGVADSTVIVNDHIHDCGVMPAANHDHGIYVQDATDTVIAHNLIDHNADRGIQLYPSSAGAVITDNVIAYNGEGVIFSGDEGVASNNNLVEHNLIVNSLIRADIESWYPVGNPIGVGNLARENCVSERGIDTSDGGFNTQGNVTAAAGEILASEGGYAVTPSSSCAAVVPDMVASLAPTPTTGNPPPSNGTGLPPTKSGPGHARKARAKHARVVSTHHRHRHGKRSRRARHARRTSHTARSHTARSHTARR